MKKGNRFGVITVCKKNRKSFNPHQDNGWNNNMDKKSHYNSCSSGSSWTLNANKKKKKPTYKQIIVAVAIGKISICD